MTVVGTLSVRSETFSLGRAFAEEDVRVELERAVQRGSKLSVWVWTTEVEQYLDRARTRADVEIAALDRVDGGVLCTVGREESSSGPWLFDLFDDAGTTVLAANGDDERWSFRLRANNRGDVERLQRVAADHGIDSTVGTVRALSRATTVQSALTDRQRRTLIAAYEGGYYDTPRRATLADFGDEFDITPRAVSQRLRRGVGNLIQATLTVD